MNTDIAERDFTLEDAERELAKAGSIGALQLRTDEAFKGAWARNGTGPALQGLGHDQARVRRDVKLLLNSFSWTPEGLPQFVARKAEAALVLLQAEARWSAVPVYHEQSLAGVRVSAPPPPTPQEMIAAFGQRGVVITVDEDGAIHATNAGQLTADERRQIISRKPEFVQLLSMGEIIA